MEIKYLVFRSFIGTCALHQIIVVSVLADATWSCPTRSYVDVVSIICQATHSVVALRVDVDSFKRDAIRVIRHIELLQSQGDGSTFLIDDGRRTINDTPSPMQGHAIHKLSSKAKYVI